MSSPENFHSSRPVDTILKTRLSVRYPSAGVSASTFSVDVRLDVFVDTLIALFPGNCPAKKRHLDGGPAPVYRLASSTHR